MSTMVEGGCLCGAVRFAVPAEPVMQLLCYCGDCMKVSGAGGYTAYIVPIDSVDLQQGETGGWQAKADSGRGNTRRFCIECGTRVWAEIPELGFASVNGLALDDRSHFKPMMNHYPHNAPDWCAVDEALDEFPAG